MSFQEMESEYGKQRKRSDYRLRLAAEKEEIQEDDRIRERRKHPLEGYEASEEELKEKREPEEQLAFKGGDRRFSAGYNRDHKLTMVFSKDKNDGKTKGEEVFHKEGSVTSRQNHKYLRTGTHRPDKDAQILEDRDLKRKQYLMGQLKKTVDGPGSSLIERSFPFLSTREEKEQIKALEDEARKNSMDRSLVEENRKKTEVLGRDIAHKEEERRDLVKKLIARVTPENLEKKRKRWMEPNRDVFAAPEADSENPPDGEGAAGEEKNKKIDEKNEEIRDVL